MIEYGPSLVLWNNMSHLEAGALLGSGYPGGSIGEHNHPMRPSHFNINPKDNRRVHIASNPRKLGTTR
jgi:hypothetical protein